MQEYKTEWDLHQTLPLRFSTTVHFTLSTLQHGALAASIFICTILPCLITVDMSPPTTLLSSLETSANIQAKLEQRAFISLFSPSSPSQGIVIQPFSARARQLLEQPGASP